MITDTAPVEAPSPRLSGRRRALVWALVVLASLIGLGSILTTWVHRQMLDEQAWKDASAGLIENRGRERAVGLPRQRALRQRGCRAALEQRLRR